MKREALQVAALRNGTVIDHIPSDKVFKVVGILGLDRMDTAVTIGYNLVSSKMGSKGIIKVSDRFFSDEELNVLSVLAPNASLCIIKDYEVVEKRRVDMPDEIRGILKCSNPKCISNNEPMSSKFRAVDKASGLVKCHYCNHEELVSSIKLL